MSAMLASRDRRALLIGSVLMVFIIGVGRGWPAFHALHSRRVKSARASITTLSTLERTLRLLPALRDSVVARQVRRATAESLLFVGASAAEVGAALIAHVDAIAEEVGVKVLSASVRPDSARFGLSRIEVQITAVTDAQGVAELISELEIEEPMVAVREMTVAGSDPGAPPTRAEALRLELVLEGLGKIGPKAIVDAPPSMRTTAEETR